MGFGLLFIGYFIALLIFLGALSPCRVIGGIIMAWAAAKLSRYHRAFTALFWLSAVSAVLYGVRMVSDLPLWITGKALYPPIVTTVLSIVDIPLTFAFHMGLLWAIHAIAKETEVEKAVLASVRNMIFYVLVLLLQLLSFIDTAVTRNLDVVAVLISFVLSVLNLILIFRCYAQICDSDDVEMKQKESRLAFVNQYREEMAQKQKKAAEKELAYRNEKRERRERKKGGKK